MDTRLVSQLRDTFPLLMAVRDDVDGLSGALSAIGAGWYPIIHELFGLFDDHQARTGQAVEVRELGRAGGRLYYSAVVPMMRESEQGMLEMVAESWSEEVCEVCGAAGFIDVTELLLSCRCVEHRRASRAKLKRDEKAFATSLLNYRRQGMAVRLFFHVVEVEQGDGADAVDVRLIRLPERIHSIRGEALLAQCQVVSCETLALSECEAFFRDLRDRAIAPVIVAGRELIAHLDLP